MRIKWIGKFNGKNLPTSVLPENAKALSEVTNKSAIILVPIILFAFILLSIKKYLLDGTVLERWPMTIGFLIGILFFSPT